MLKAAVISVYSKHISCIYSQSRFIRHKPWIPKFRLLRQLQPFDPPLDLHSETTAGSQNESVSEMRQRLKRQGLLPPVIFQDRPINIGHTGQVTDQYKPREGDGLVSFLSSKKVKEEVDALWKKGKSYRELLKIRSHEPTFNPKVFANEAESIYLEAHRLLQDVPKNEPRLFELVTEKAFAEMTDGLKFRTLRWNFVGSIEPPQVVHIRTQELLSKGNIYGQVTVRLHTQQTLAIYDRFGRLIFGHPSSPADVLEFVVFEKHISDEYGVWRIHAKIVPDWIPPRGVLIPTQRLIPTTTDSSTSADQALTVNNEPAAV